MTTVRIAGDPSDHPSSATDEPDSDATLMLAFADYATEEVDALTHRYPGMGVFFQCEIHSMLHCDGTRGVAFAYAVFILPGCETASGGLREQCSVFKAHTPNAAFAAAKKAISSSPYWTELRYSVKDCSAPHTPAWPTES